VALGEKAEELLDWRPGLAVSFDAATGEFNGFTKIIAGTTYEIAERLDEAANLLEKLPGVVMSGNEKVIGTIERGNEKIIKTIEQGNQLLARKQDQTIAILESTKEDTTVMRRSGEPERFGRYAHRAAGGECGAAREPWSVTSWWCRAEEAGARVRLGYVAHLTALVRRSLLAVKST
jgi:hypothetical protein